ncbi:MAG: AAA family ATPase, partial [Acidimicrobiales bacterium]
MTLSSLWIRDFRCFEEARIRPDPSGLTVLHGANGAGKTSVLEAIGWLATLRSFRGAVRETVVRRGARSAVLRAETAVLDRIAAIELEITPERAGRTLLNRQLVRRRSELAQALRVSVFSPADRVLVEGGPAERRNFLDELLAGRSQRLEALVDEVAQVLRQRTALLRQSGGRLDAEIGTTLDVWDSRLAISGAELASEREKLAAALEPLVIDAYSHLAGVADRVSLSYERSWDGDLSKA